MLMRTVTVQNEPQWFRQHRTIRRLRAHPPLATTAKPASWRHRSKRSLGAAGGAGDYMPAPASASYHRNMRRRRYRVKRYCPPAANNSPPLAFVIIIFAVVFEGPNNPRATNKCKNKRRCCPMPPKKKEHQQCQYVMDQLLPQCAVVNNVHEILLHSIFPAPSLAPTNIIIKVIAVSEKPEINIMYENCGS